MKYIATVVVEADDEAHARRMFKQYERMAGVKVEPTSIAPYDSGPRNMYAKDETKPVHGKWLVMTALTEGAAYTAEIARRTGLSHTATANWLTEMLSDGWVEESRDFTGGRTRWVLTTEGYKNMRLGRIKEEND